VAYICMYLFRLSVPFNGVASCQDYTGSMANKYGALVEAADKRKLTSLEKLMFYCYVIHRHYHIDWSGIENERPR